MKPEALTKQLRAQIQSIVGTDVELPKEVEDAVGELYVFLAFISLVYMACTLHGHGEQKARACERGLRFPPLLFHVDSFLLSFVANAAVDTQCPCSNGGSAKHSLLPRRPRRAGSDQDNHAAVCARQWVLCC